MGALTPVIGTLGTVLGAVNTVERVVGKVRDYSGDAEDDRRRRLRAQQDLALKQLKQQQTAKMDDAATDAALDKAKISTERESAEAKRRAALRRAVARQNVNFASRGLSKNDSGSSEAILLGLFDESDDDRTQREKLDTIRNRAIDSDLAAKSRLNVLQRTQLQEKQRLERELLE